MTTAPNHILDRLERVTQERDGQWNARCPGHDDNRNSLAVSVTTDGTVLLKCHAGCSTPDVLATIGLCMKDLFPQSNGKPRIAVVYDYRDESGTLLYQVCRFEPKDFRQRKPKSGGGWEWKLNGVQRVLYNLPKLLAADPSVTVFIPEGEKDCDTLALLGLLATTNAGGAGKWRDEYNDSLGGRHVVILPDADEPGRKHAEQVAASLAGVSASIRIVELPDLPDKGDVSDWLAADGTAARLAEIVAAAPEWKPIDRPRDPKQEKEKRRRPSQAAALMELTAGIELFHAPGADADGFAVVPIRNHLETWRIGSKGFREWLRRKFWEKTKSVPNAESLQGAIGVLTGKALYDGAEHPVAVRVAEHDGAIYLDLADTEWHAVRVTADGWKVVSNPPVRFIRPRGVLALPTPEHGGTLAELREFVNLADDDDWALLAAWLVASVRPSGPYPLLALHGEQGSAKSTTARILRAIIDPNAAPLRCEPREPRDLMIAASNGWLVAADNLSSVPVWLSDALCRLSTGGGFATRELYSDGDEKLFDAMRPVILTGIAELATRSDLLDRTIALTLPAIPEDRRRSEAQLWQEFECVRPRILGALLKGVATALRNVDTVTLPALPRMADFAIWATAAESALGIRSGAFLAAYAGNRATLNESAIESSPVAGTLLAFMAGREGWTGTATELLSALAELAGEKVSKSREWPKRPHLLSAGLRRIAPNLRRIGMDVDFGRSKRLRAITVTRTDAQNSVTGVTSVTTTAGVPKSGDARTSDSVIDRHPASPTTAENFLKTDVDDAGDAGDAESVLFSDAGSEVVEWTA